MTVSTELSHEEYVGNGVTTDFDFRFRIFEGKHLIVVVADNDGNETILKNGTDYTIVGAGSYHGGKVVLNKPLAQGWKILLERDLPVVQETDLRNQGKFFAEVHEDAFDYLTMLIQKALGTFSLSLRKPTYLSNYYDAKGNRIANLAPPKTGSDATNKDYVDNSIKYIDSKTLRVKDKAIPALPNADERAGKVLTFDENGYPIAVSPASGSAIDVLNMLGSMDGYSFIGTSNYTQLRNYIGSRETVFVTGRVSKYDGGEGIFFCDTQDNYSIDNDGTILIDSLNRRWKRVISDNKINVKWFCSGVDYTQALNKAIISAGINGVIYLPEGTYLTNGMHMPLEGQKIYGDNARLCSAGNASLNEIFHIENNNITVDGIIIDGGAWEKGSTPEIAIGIRVGENKQVNNIKILNTRVLGCVYGIFISSVLNSTFKNCTSIRCSDGFRISGKQDLSNSSKAENIFFENCIASENGITYMPESGVGSIGGYAGYKITDISINNINFISCIAEYNCGFGFDVHAHDYQDIPLDFEMKGIYFLNCTSKNNNIPNDNLPLGFISGAGNCSGFYIGSIGIPIKDIHISRCKIYNHYGESIYARALNDHKLNMNLIENLNINECVIKGSERISNSSVRTSNSVIYVSGSRNLSISSNSISNIEYLYDFVYYINSSRANVFISNEVFDTTPNLIYAKSTPMVGILSRLKIENINSRYGELMKKETTKVFIRAIDYEEINIEGISVMDISNKQENAMVYGVLQQNTTKDSKVIKVNNCTFSCLNSSQIKMTSAIEINTISGSKLFSGNTLFSSKIGFSGNGTENAIIANNHFDKSTVITPITGFQPSSIIKGNFGLGDN